ncbi:hypothetical protein Q3G72_028301 [Acer saccharum]|nr:hypothetical protein Q3G72_028301 [Acer saccharum]
MAAAFCFSAQPEPKLSANMDDKPPDPIASTKRARVNDSGDSDKCGRVGHNKEACREGAAEQNEGVRGPEQGLHAGDGVQDPYGPWLQVTYGKNGRHMGAGYTGRRSNFQSHIGKSGIGKKNGLEAKASVEEVPRQSKEMGNISTDIQRKGVDRRDGRMNSTGASNENGSRLLRRYLVVVG